MTTRFWKYKTHKIFWKTNKQDNKYKEKVRHDKGERPQRIQGVKHYYSTNYVQIASQLA